MKIAYVPLNPAEREALASPLWSGAYDDWEDVLDSASGLIGMYSRTFPRPLHAVEPDAEWRGVDDALRRLAGTPLERHARHNATAARDLWHRCQESAAGADLIVDVEAYLNALHVDTLFLEPHSGRAAASSKA